MYPSREADKFMLRLPEGLRDFIKIQAATNRRSMNAEVVVQLERAYGLQVTAAGGMSPNLSPAAVRNTAACQGSDIITQG